MFMKDAGNKGRDNEPFSLSFNTTRDTQAHRNGLKRDRNKTEAPHDRYQFLGRRF